MFEKTKNHLKDFCPPKTNEIILVIALLNLR